MSAAHVTIENLTRRHLSDAVEVIAQAFYKNGLARHALRGVDEQTRLKRVRRIYRGVMEVALQKGRVFVVRREGRIAGAAVAYPPSEQGMGFVSRAISGMGVITVGPAATGRYVAYEREIQKMRPKMPHWYLFFLGVTPAYHGQGIGTAFVRHICRLADADHVPCYLETTVEQQLEFYARHGFVHEETRPLKFLDDMHVSGMLRPAKTA